VNPLNAYKTLSDNETIRAALLSQAQNSTFVADGSENATVSQETNERPQAALQARLHRELSGIDRIVGWSNGIDDGFRGAKSIVGWLISLLAISLGSQFWFDILKKFINIRSSGAAAATAEAGRQGNE
jgi:hypothetical protein